MMSKGVVRAVKGGPGSGNYGHAGRPGLVGGSGGGAGVGAMGVGQPTGGDVKGANTFLSRGIEPPHSRAWMLAVYDERADIKRAIIDELSERSGVDSTIVNAVIQQWAITSNDGDLRSLSLQEAAAEELGLKLSAWQQESLDYVNRKLEAYDPTLATVPKSVDITTITSRTNERAIIRAMYDHTQEELAKAGYKPGDTVQLYRGITYTTDPGSHDGNIVNYKGNSTESWSVSDKVARTFAVNKNYPWGEVVSMAVPVSSIIGTARTGYGCLTEGEFVIAGNVPGSKATVQEVIEYNRERYYGGE